VLEDTTHEHSFKIVLFFVWLNKTSQFLLGSEKDAVEFICCTRTKAFIIIWVWRKRSCLEQ